MVSAITRHTLCVCAVAVQHTTFRRSDVLLVAIQRRELGSLTGASKRIEERQPELAVCATSKYFIAALKMDSVRELRPSLRKEGVEQPLLPVLPANKKMYP